MCLAASRQFSAWPVVLVLFLSLAMGGLAGWFVWSGMRQSEQKNLETQNLVRITDLGILVDRYLGVVGQQQALYVLAQQVNPKDSAVRREEFLRSLGYLDELVHELQRFPLEQNGLDAQAIARLNENIKNFKSLDQKIWLDDQKVTAASIETANMLMYEKALPLIGVAIINMGFFNRSITERITRIGEDGRDLMDQTVRWFVGLGVLALSLGGVSFSVLLRAVQHQRRLVQKLDQLSSLDGLTGLDNRRSWDARAPVELERAQRTGKFAVLAVIDLDHFKRFNDAHGHLAGDERLRVFARVLQKLSRSTDLVARYGGEEFVVLLPDCSLEGAQDFLGRVRQHLPEVAFSAGVTPTNGFETLENVMVRADAAMYQAKSAGRDRVVVMKRDTTSGQHVPLSSA